MTRPAIRILIVLVVAMGTALGAPALAQDDADEEAEASPFIEDGSYLSVGATGGWSDLDNQIGGDPISREPSNLGPIDDAEGPRFGIRIRAGHRAARYFVWELEYLYVAGIQVDSVREDSTFDVHSLMWSLKAYPLVDLLDPVLGGRIAPYVAAGTGLVKADNSGIDKTLDLGVRFGGGSDFHIDSNWSLYAEASYHMGTMNLRRLDYLVYGLGVAYHFD